MKKTKKILLLIIIIFFVPLSFGTASAESTSIPTDPVIEQQLSLIYEILSVISTRLNNLAAERVATSTPTMESKPVSAPAKEASGTKASQSDSDSSSGSLLGGNRPFGGQVTQITDCTCSSYRRIQITPPLPQLPYSLMYDSTKAITYNFNQIRIGVYLLGTHGDDESCMVYVINSCVNVGSGKDVIMVGTSL